MKEYNIQIKKCSMHLISNQKLILISLIKTICHSLKYFRRTLNSLSILRIQIKWMLLDFRTNKVASHQLLRRNIKHLTNKTSLNNYKKMKDGQKAHIQAKDLRMTKMKKTQNGLNLILKKKEQNS